MKRKISNKHAEIIKIMMTKGYSNSSIRDELLIKHGQNITASQLQTIKKGQAYLDVREDLNELMFAKYQVKRNIDEQLIADIKWALAEGYSDAEILEVYKLSKAKLYSIRMLFAPYLNIAPEYNDDIMALRTRHKKVNIDRKLVIEIKKKYVLSNGKMNRSEIADSLNINKGTVSSIINLKTYIEYGRSYNNKIIAIRNKIEKAKKKRETLKKIRKNKLRAINVLRDKRDYYNNLIKDKQNELKKEIA